MTRKQASTIFKIKTRMLKVKNNFRNNSDNIKCRACNEKDETQEHVLSECPAIHVDTSLKVSNMEVEADDVETLKLVSTKVEKIMAKLEENPQR